MTAYCESAVTVYMLMAGRAYNSRNLQLAVLVYLIILLLCAL